MMVNKYLPSGDCWKGHNADGFQSLRCGFLGSFHYSIEKFPSNFLYLSIVKINAIVTKLFIR